MSLSSLELARPSLLGAFPEALDQTGSYHTSPISYPALAELGPPLPCSSSAKLTLGSSSPGKHLTPQGACCSHCLACCSRVPVTLLWLFVQGISSEEAPRPPTNLYHPLPTLYFLFTALITAWHSVTTDRSLVGFPTDTQAPWADVAYLSLYLQCPQWLLHFIGARYTSTEKMNIITDIPHTPTSQDLLQTNFIEIGAQGGGHSASPPSNVDLAPVGLCKKSSDLP